MQTEAEKKARREAWFNRLNEAIEKVGPPLNVNLFPETDTPEWVHKLEIEFGKSLFPAAKLKKGNEITPKRMGALLGHQCSIAVWLMDLFEHEFEKLDGKGIELKDSNIEPEQLKEGEKASRGLIETWYPGMCKLAKRVLCLCVDQDFDDMTDFLRGFADGFGSKPKTFKIGEMGTTAFEVHFFMLWHWRSVAQLNSVAHLHKVLAKLLGAQRAGDLKRTEKICQRVGLHFRKPGRPKKQK